MNKQRRLELSKIWDELNEQKDIRGNKIDEIMMNLTDNTAAAKECFEDFKERIQEILDEESEAYDNLPEGLQNAEKGQQIQEAIDYMEESITKLDEVIERLEIDMTLLDFRSDCQESLDAIDNAKGEI